ncbi:MAG TPA: DUF58 domain-containing protein [Candidatus Latescibacteria bacterium]|nr:DUF58 domain-containing protein [Candidatus Latescibacterota bacterium]
MTPDYRLYLNPQLVSKLSRLDIIARLVVEGFITGLHRSPYHGFSVEFAENRQYMPGDPTRYIDWKAYGKSERLFVKTFEEETNLKSYLLLDASGSMGFSSEGISKIQYASYLAAALTYLMLRQRDAVGLVIFDSRIRSYIPPRSAKSHLSVILKELANTETSSDTKMEAVFHQLAERIKRRGLIIVISDLLDDADKVLFGLRHFRHRKHEVIVFHLLDPREKDFGFEQEARFVDIETGEEVRADPRLIRQEYCSRVSTLVERYRRGCRESLVDYVPISTDEDLDTALFRYLLKRKRLG